MIGISVLRSPDLCDMRKELRNMKNANFESAVLQMKSEYKNAKFGRSRKLYIFSSECLIS